MKYGPLILHIWWAPSESNGKKHEMYTYIKLRGIYIDHWMIIGRLCIAKAIDTYHLKLTLFKGTPEINVYTQQSQQYTCLCTMYSEQCPYIYIEREKGHGCMCVCNYCLCIKIKY